ncbi:MAG: TniQ family protein [Pseudomonadota bacterium]
MITDLPIKKPALAGEPGFSVLARNTAVNGSATTAEFCASTGLSKAAICAGKPNELTQLAELTSSPAKALLSNSPHVLDRKFIDFGDNKLLYRSIRRADLLICPQCWVDDMAISGTNIHIRSTWLPKTFHTCALHHTALIGLPVKDYTTWYDHMTRSRLETNWLQRLEDRITPLSQSSFEKAAHDNLTFKSPIYPWLGHQQLDVLEQWALGVGFIVKRGYGVPTKLDKKDHRSFIDIGHEIMLSGEDKLCDELDAAVIRHRTRLTNTWLHQWATQTTLPPERKSFRELIRKINDHQGRYNILNGSRKHAQELYIRTEIDALAAQTLRSKNWVRRTLQRECLLPTGEAIDEVSLRAQIHRCKAYIRAVVSSLNAIESAQKLRIGVKGFETLARAGIVKRIKGRAHKKPRFKPSDLDGLLCQIESKLKQVAAASPTEFCSIADACFQYRLDTATITALLLGDQLPNAVRVNGTLGYEGIYISRSDIGLAIKVLNDEIVPPSQLQKELGLSFAALKELDGLGLLPSFSNSRTNTPRAPKRVSRTTLGLFLNTYQTVTSAARVLGVDEAQVYKKIGEQQVEWATEGGGVPIFYRTDLLD